MTSWKAFSPLKLDISTEFGLDVQDCPFCGDTTGWRTRWLALEALDTDDGLVWRTACCYCGCRGPMAATEEKAIFAWNQRQRQ